MPTRVASRAPTSVGAGGFRCKRVALQTRSDVVIAVYTVGDGANAGGAADARRLQQARAAMQAGWRRCEGKVARQEPGGVASTWWRCRHAVLQHARVASQARGGAADARCWNRHGW